MQRRAFESAAITGYRSRASWDAAAVEILAVMLDRWELTPGAVFSGGYAATVLAVTRSDGTPAVLKIGFPHPEGVPEAIALEAWPAGTAPVVLRQDPWTWSMLLERIEPGVPLSAADTGVGAALQAAGKLLARIAAAEPVFGIPSMRSVAQAYAAAARHRFDAHRPNLDELEATELVAAGLDELENLAGTGIETSMVHGDFNPGNILQSAAGLVAVDPKAMIGDPAYDLWPLVSQLGSPVDRLDPQGTLARQLAIAADAAGVDPVRAARWSFARSALNVSWYIDERQPRLAARDAELLRAWAGVLAGIRTGTGI